MVSVLSLLWIFGCTQIPPTNYYTFRPDVEKLEITTSVKYPYTLLIETFEADIPYNQDKIVYRLSPYEVNFYEYHKWLRSPEDLITERVVKLLSSTDMFRRVQTQVFDTYPDYALLGRIKMFDQWDEGTTPFVRVQIEYALTVPREERILWMHTVDTIETLSSPAIVETVKGFETALHNNILQLLFEIHGVLSQQK